MPVNYRSRKAKLAAVSAQLREEGKTWAEIATVIAATEHESPLVAMRLAHGLSQPQVADRWNELYPDDRVPMTSKMISYWEVWPTGSGHQPTLKTLAKLARIYHCEVADLIDVATLAETSGAEVPERPTVEPVVLRAPVRREERAGEGAAVPVLLDKRGDASTPNLLIPTDLQLPPDLAVVFQQCLTPLTGIDTGVKLSARQRDAVFGQLVAFLRTWAHTMKRREVLQLLGWAASTAVAIPTTPFLNPAEQERVAGAIESPSRVDAAVVDHIEEVLWHCIRQDAARGPQAVLDTLLAQRQLAKVMLVDVGSSLRPRLLSVYSRLSEVTGWLCFDLGDYDSAWYYYEEARSSAHEARNTELGALVLSHMSHTATWQRRARVGIDHAVAAQGWAKRSDDVVLQAYTADVAARAYAADGQYDACMDELDTARAGLAASGGKPSIVHFYDEGLLASIRGQCLLQLGRPTEAYEATTHSLTLLDPAYVRDLAMTKADLAVSMMQLSEIDESARLLGEAATLATRNRSSRLIGQIRDSRTLLQPWRDTRAVTDLDGLLAEYHLV